MSTPITSEAPHKRESSGPFHGPRGLVLLRPFHRQRNRNACSAALFEKRSELLEPSFSVMQFKSQTATHIDIPINCFTPWGHSAPPGQGKANVASETRSTFA